MYIVKRRYKQNLLVIFYIVINSFTLSCYPQRIRNNTIY